MSRPRTVARWCGSELAAGGGLGAGMRAGGWERERRVYEHHHRQEVATDCGGRGGGKAAEAGRASSALAQEEEDLLAKVDSDVSREVPSAMEPLAQLMAEDETEVTSETEKYEKAPGSSGAKEKRMKSRNGRTVGFGDCGSFDGGSRRWRRDPGGGQGAGPGFGDHQASHVSGRSARRRRRRWWNNPKVVERLKLTDDQRKAMDGIMLEHREKLIDLRANLEKAELEMEPLMSADQPNERQILAQIDKVAQARGDLEKANARFLLAIRDKLTPDQWKQVRDFRATRWNARRAEMETGRAKAGNAWT